MDRINARRRMSALATVLLFSLMQPGFTCAIECLYHEVPSHSSARMVHASVASCHDGAVTHTPVPSVSIGLITAVPQLSKRASIEFRSKPQGAAARPALYVDRDTPPPRG